MEVIMDQKTALLTWDREAHEANIELDGHGHSIREDMKIVRRFLDERPWRAGMRRCAPDDPSQVMQQLAYLLDFRGFVVRFGAGIDAQGANPQA